MEETVQKLAKIKARVEEKAKTKKTLTKEDKCNWYCIFMSFKLHEMYHKIDKDYI